MAAVWLYGFSVDNEGSFLKFYLLSKKEEGEREEKFRFKFIYFFVLIGKGCKTDINEAYKYHQKACDLNNDNGCLHAGVLAITNQLEDDYSTQINKGVNMLKKACYQLHSEKACFFLSGVYMNGIENHVEKNFKEAYKLSLKSCEYGNPYACANVSQMHLRGDGVKKDSELAKIFQERADQLVKELKRSPSLKFQQGIEN